MRVKVFYKGFYVVEADSLEEALETDRETAYTLYEEWENTKACVAEERQ